METIWKNMIHIFPYNFVNHNINILGDFHKKGKGNDTWQIN